MAVRGVPFYRMKFTKSELSAVEKVLKSGWLTSGRVAREFEQKVADYVGSKYAVAVNSCTAGLHLALKALAVGKGDEVITTPFTFAASIEAILHAGAKPVFIDIEPDTLNLDASQLEAKLNSKTRAIMPVHIAGLPCDMSAIKRIAKKHDLRIVHDAAHALGASYGKKKIGAIPDISCFSFYATKNLTTGEGGMVTTDNREVAEKIRVLSLHGMDKKAWRRYLDCGSWYYEVVELGYKYNLADINAALGLAMMKRFEKLQKKRSEVAERYSRAISEIDGLRLPAMKKGRTHAWHLYIIQLMPNRLSIDRDHFIQELTARNIGTSVHFIPLFKHPYYKGKYGLRAECFPNSEQAYKQVISLPFYPDLAKPEITYVVRALGDIVKRHKKL